MENQSQQKRTIPRQFSNVFGMGAPVEVFPSKSRLAVYVILIGFLVLGGGSAFAYALYILWQRWGRYYPPVILRDMLPWVIGAVIALGLGLLLLWEYYTRRKKAAVVYTNGFAYSDRKGVTSWHWDQVTDITANVIRHYTNGIPTGTTHQYTLVNKQGDKIVVNDAIQNVETLYTHIQNNTLQHRYQRLANAYNSGSPVTFGTVTISKEAGIQIGKKTYPWDEIEEVAINKGMLSVKKKGGKWFSGASATAGSIPNLHVLLSIINQIVGLKAGN